jgi:uncharacterized membrane protein YhiD involved in acid resistance
MSSRKPPYGRDGYDGSPPEERDPKMSADRWPEVRRSAQEAVRRAGSRGPKKTRGRLSGLANRTVFLVVALIAGLIALSVIGYLLIGRQSTSPAPAAQQTQRQSQPPDTPSPPAQPPAASRDGGFFSSLFGGESPEPQRNENWLQTAARILLKLALAALLTAILAFRPRKDMPLMQRNPYVAQTQILLAVVAAALMMVVADNAARAFGIFAAASLVRFRTNIRDPKEITVLLVSLAIGLASGVGRVEVAIILALFVLLMLWVLEYYEPAQIFRELEITIKTRNVDETDEFLKEIFEKHSIDSELREIDRQDDEDALGKIVYRVNVPPTISTDRVSEELFGADTHNIDSIEWDQKKTTSYIYR